jgi:hypothetical protein
MASNQHCKIKISKCRNPPLPRRRKKSEAAPDNSNSSGRGGSSSSGSSSEPKLREVWSTVQCSLAGKLNQPVRKEFQQCLDQLAVYTSQAMMILTMVVQRHLARVLRRMYPPEQSLEQPLQLPFTIDQRYMSFIKTAITGAKPNAKLIKNGPPSYLDEIRTIAIELKTAIPAFRSTAQTGLPATAVGQIMMFHIRMIETNHKNHLKMHAEDMLHSFVTSWIRRCLAPRDLADWKSVRRSFWEMVKTGKDTVRHRYIMPSLTELHEIYNTAKREMVLCVKANEESKQPQAQAAAVNIAAHRDARVDFPRLCSLYSWLRIRLQRQPVEHHNHEAEKEFSVFPQSSLSVHFFRLDTTVLRGIDAHLGKAERAKNRKRKGGSSKHDQSTSKKQKPDTHVVSDNPLPEQEPSAGSAAGSKRKHDPKVVVVSKPQTKKTKVRPTSVVPHMHTC